MLKRFAALAAATIAAATLCADALELEPVEPALEKESARIETSATLRAAAVPGKNILTGTDEPETFDSYPTGNAPDIPELGKISYWAVQAASVASLDNDRADGILSETVEGNDSAKALRVFAANNSGSVFPVVDLNYGLENGRRYHLSFDIYQNVAANTGFAFYLCASNPGETVIADFRVGSDFHSALTTGNWLSFSGTYDWNYTGTAVRFNVQHGPNSGDMYTYYDNISVVPYYKVTYVMPDQSTQTDWVLYDNSGALLTVYTPKEDNLPGGCLGWTTEQGGETPMTGVPLADSDITLYAVKSTEPQWLDQSVKVLGSAAGSYYGIKNDYDTEWQIDMGHTEAEYTVNATEFRFTAAGYAGEITVNAKNTATGEVSTRTLLLLGSPLFRPGLDIVTGEEKPFGFENLTADEVRRAYTLESFVLADNPCTTDGVNASDKVLMSGGNMYSLTKMATTLSPTMELERPVELEYDFYGFTNNNWFMLNNMSGSKDIYATIGGGDKAGWTHFKRAGFPLSDEVKNTHSASGVSWFGFEHGSFDAAAPFCVDNIRITPFYRITYYNADGSSVIGTEYVLTDEKGNRLSDFTPDAEHLPAGMGGWALAPGGERVVRVPLENKDIVLYPVVSDKIAFSDGETDSFVAVTDGALTVPAPAEIGMKTKDFVAWYDGGRAYTPGESVQAALLVGKLLSGFYQDAESPAMGYAFEGDRGNVGVEAIETSVVKDENRTVLRLVQNKNTWNETTGKWQNDSRAFIDTKYGNMTAFDPKEYPIVSYHYKINSSIDVPIETAPDALTDADMTANDNPRFVINYSVSDEYNGFFMPGGEHKIAGDQYTTVGGYHLFTADMRDEANSHSACPWNSVEQMHGFVIQPNAAYYYGDTYVDYLRVYRGGITTVTYDTNAPDGYEELILAKVAPDTGRGVGKGYLLTGEQPEIEELTFVGWALTPDASVADVVNAIDLTGDTTVYAVWVEEASLVPQTLAKNQIRTSDPMGLRFAALIDLPVKTGNTTALPSLAGVSPDEYGFIVSRKALLGERELNFGFGPDENGKGVTSDGVTYVSGAAFKRVGDAVVTDIVYDIDGSRLPEVTEGENEAFTAVVTNIPDTMYDDVIVARPYIRFGDRYFYGEAREASLTMIAEEMNKNYDSLSQAEKDVVDKILA